MKVGFFSLIAIILMTLKLTHTINVSWWIVVAPLAIGFLWYCFWVVVIGILKAIAE